MTIFEALRISHEIQRELAQQLLATRGDSPEREEGFTRLRNELEVHSLAEERHFYVPLLQLDGGVELSRHAIAEHHEMDELIEELAQTALSSPGWLPKARALAEKVEHHLGEEEHGFFQRAGKLLGERQKKTLAQEYLRAYDELKKSA
ncbi:hemerythrin domain-containing protein [Pseudomonas sp. NCCP-436]|uniref:hemerythrin domain-containing protein n=1 Tax=Pseudomonas sp. NCCP-436 TaxID=2842481 RepID=UPI001C80E994|nr:hemerythrin domain-containing protein [Pseudomonas sp. NCCP-436]GIZ12984.1 hemerythrin [Pseudomonas sp. NCCP-436]